MRGSLPQSASIVRCGSLPRRRLFSAATMGQSSRRKAATLRRAFHDAYVVNGRIESDCTTVYAMAIVFGILDEAGIAIAGERLAELARASGHRISTGLLGTPYICDALARTGHLEDAYAMLLETGCPSGSIR